MIAGEMYNPNDEQLVKDKEAAKRFCREYNLTDDTNYDLRKKMIQSFLGKTGKDLHIESNFMDIILKLEKIFIQTMIAYS